MIQLYICGGIPEILADAATWSLSEGRTCRPLSCAGRERRRKAHQSARNFRPDLILLDIMVPQRDGGDIAAQIDADPGFHRTPIVFSPRWSRKPMQKPGHREHLYAMDVGRGITQILLSNGCRYAKKNADLRPFEVNRSCAFRSLPDNCWKCSEIIADNLSKAGLELGLRLSH